jgi:hypothetical protein
MSVVNRRNAVLGWAIWTAAKPVIKHKAKTAVPGTVEGTHRPNRSATALAALAAVTGALLVRKHRDDGNELARG